MENISTWTYDSLSHRSCRSSRGIRRTATPRGHTSHQHTWSFQECCTLWWRCCLAAAGFLVEKKEVRWLPTIFLDRCRICNVTIFNAFKTGKCLLNAETEVCFQRHLKLPPWAETLNIETPNPRLWSFRLTQQLPAGAEWAGMRNATFLAEVWHVSVRASPKPYWVAEMSAAGLGNLLPTWTESRGVESEAECHCEVRISSTDVRCSRHFWTAASWRRNNLCICTKRGRNGETKSRIKICCKYQLYMNYYYLLEFNERKKKNMVDSDS